MLLSIIIPVYNEKASLAEILKRAEIARLPEGMEREIIIADDCSTDGSAEILKKLAGRHKVIRHGKNRGKGAAIRSALAKAAGDIILTQDADLEYDPADYYELLVPIVSGEAPAVYGSRFLKGRKPRYWHFYLGNKFLSLLSSLLFFRKISDMETGYKAARREVIMSLGLKSDRFGIEPEITAKLLKRGYKIKEVPVSYQSRSFQEGKKINWKDGVSAIYHLIKFRFFD